MGIAKRIPPDLRGIMVHLPVLQHDAWHVANKYEPRLYVDTMDAIRGVLGDQEYLIAGEKDRPIVDLPRFNEPWVLVDALLAAGMLGPFSMLPPHQAEFLRKLKEDDAFNHHPRPVEQSAFLHAVGIDGRWGANKGGVINEDALRSVLSHYVGLKTEKFFKAIQCIRMPWWERLRQLRNTGKFLPFDESMNYVELAKRPELGVLQEAFQRRRGHAGHFFNDMADSMSMLMLMELVQRHAQGATIVPRFYDSTGTFAGVARDTNLLDRLTIESGGFSTCALVTTEALKYRASLLAADMQEGVLIRLSECMPEDAQVARNMSEADNLLGHRHRKAFGDQLLHLIDLSFLENVWLRSMAGAELRDIAKRWMADTARTESFRKNVDATIDESVDGVLNRAMEYKRFSSLWNGLRKAMGEWRRMRRTLESQASEGAPEQDVGIFRFSPPPAIQAHVDQVLEIIGDATRDETQVTATTAWHEVVEWCVALEQAPGGGTAAETRRRAEIVAGVLWEIRADPWIVDILARYAESGRSIFATTVYLAAILREGRDPQRAEQGTRELTERLLAMIGTEPAAGKCTPEMLCASSSVAYLWFHVWRTKWNLPAWWRCPAEAAQHADRRAATDGYLRRAIEFVDRAWQCVRALESDDSLRARRMYITNQRLYYLVEQGDASRMDDVRQAYLELDGFRNTTNALWRTTYSDTLARYWALRAFHARRPEDWREFVRHAKDNFEDARPALRSQQVVRSFGEYLTSLSTQGFVMKDAA
jgi:hypothetical protein